MEVRPETDLRSRLNISSKLGRKDTKAVNKTVVLKL